MGEVDFKEKLRILPQSPGVYEMLNEDNKIIYVGKALNLRNRVSSYFKGQRDKKTETLVKNIRDFRFTVTSNEVEALILEANLIKEKMPKYNILLRDDKHFPYLKINVNGDFPRLEIVRRRVKDGSLYFGPYPSGQQLREVKNLLENIFKLRTCSDHELKNRIKPCLNYQIKRCLAPCTGGISPEEYKKLLGDVVLFLNGKEKNILNKMKKSMEMASMEMEFEKAALYRDQIEGIKKILVTQNMDSKDFGAQDVLGFFREGNSACVCIMLVRNGKVLGKENTFLQQVEEESKENILMAFLEQYYPFREIPKEIILPFNLKGLEEEEMVLKEFLQYKKGSKVVFTYPQRGNKKKLVELSVQNAKSGLLERIALKISQDQRRLKGLKELRETLQLSKDPERIECYDISNISGTNTVASMVVFTNGVPDNKSYRKFKIRTVIGPNDFMSMEEVLKRRFGNFKTAKEGFNILPDLLIIDGGKGQLTSARKILRELGLEDVATFGLAKKEELLYREGEGTPIILPRDSEGLFLIQRIRDEAHRFAITFHRSLRAKEMVQSVFDEINGIGPKKKKDLLAHFGSVQNIRKASLEEVSRVLGSNKLGIIVKDVLGDE